MADPLQIRPFHPEDLEAIVRLSLRAWAPVFESIASVMNPEVYAEFYPEDWCISQQQAVETVCHNPEMRVWVAENEGQPVGFIAAKVDADSRIG